MWFFIVISIVLRFLGNLLFRRKKLPEFIERLDDEMTSELSNYRRDRVVKFLNWFFALQLMQWLMSRILSLALKSEFVAIDYTLQTDSRAFADRETRKILENKERGHWNNWVNIQSSEPLQILIPGNGRYTEVVENYGGMTDYDFTGLNEVQQIVKDAEARKLRVRCVASGHALSDIDVTTDYLIISKKMTLPQRRANQSFIKEKFRNGYKVVTRHDESFRTENRYLFETGSGTLIVDLKQILEKEGLAFQNLGGSDVQGIFGAVSTSTHGTGKHLPPFPDLIKSLVLVAAGGKAYRIEPADGITDPVEYKKSVDYTQHGIDLIQNDDDFQSAIVAMGCFGVVFSVIMEVMDLYYLHEDREPSTWEQEKEELLDPAKNYLHQYRHVDISINPYPLNESGELDRINGKHFCLVNTRNYCGIGRDGDPKKKDYNEKKRRNFLSSLVAGIYFAGSISVWLFNRNPKSIPKSIRNSLMRIVDYKKDGLGYEAVYYDVLNQGLQQMKFFGYALELSFPVENNRYIEAIDHIINRITDMAEFEQYLPAPIAIRFVDASHSNLSMMSGRQTCTVEIFSLKDFIGGKEVLERLEREMYQFGARPHWGLNFNTIDVQKMEEIYPKFHEWKTAFQQIQQQRRLQQCIY